MMPLPEVVARRWTEAKRAVESSARSGSRPGSGVDVDAILDEMAKLIRSVGREELEAVVRLSGATPQPTPRQPVIVANPSPAGPVVTADLLDSGGDPAATSAGTANGRRDATTDLPPVRVVGNPDVTGELDGAAEPNATGAGDEAFSVDPAGGGTGEFAPRVERTGEYTPAEGDAPTPTHARGSGAAAAKRKTPIVPGYEITGVLGRGGMGVVYRASQLRLRRTVALKMILSGEHATAGQLARFEAEARAVALIDHPGIVKIHEIGEHEGLPFFSLEFCPGGSLDAKLDHKPQPPRDAAVLAEKLARAMAAAHAVGVVHRDIKPANVLLDATGEPKVTDFGLARELDDASGNTRTGSILGTPSYMAPEQAFGKNKEVGPAADQYGLGATLYELITGRPPFQGSNAMETVVQVRTREPVAPSQLQPGCPKDLETICLKTLQKDPEKRYGSCTDFADDLRAYLDGRPIAARPVGRVEKAWRWAKRNPRVAGLTAAVALLLVALAAGGTTAAVVFENKRLQAVQLSEERRVAQEDAEAKRLEAEAARAQETIALGKMTQARDDEAVARKAEEQGYTLTRETVFVALDEIPAALAQAVFARGAEQQVLEALGGMLDKQLGLALTRGLPDRAVLTFRIKMGDLLARQGKAADAEKNYREALTIAARLEMAEGKEKDKAKGNRALVIRQLGSLIRNTSSNGFAPALALYTEAAGLQREIVDRPTTGEIPPAEAKASLAGTLADTAELYVRASVFDKALVPCAEALKLRAEVAALPATAYTATAGRALAESHVQYGLILARLGKDDEADRALAEGVGRYKAILAARPGNVGLQIAAATAYREYGDFLLMRGKLAEAAHPHAWDLELSRGLMRTPELLAAQNQLADVYYRSATLALKNGDRPAANGYYRKCLDLRAAVAETRPNDVMQIIRVANAQARCGLHAEAAKAMEMLVALPQFKTNRFVIRQAAFNIAICPDAVQAGRPDDKLTAAEKSLRDGYADRALTLIEDLVTRLGYADVVQLKTDPDLDAIRSQPRFAAVVRRLEAASPKP